MSVPNVTPDSLVSATGESAGSQNLLSPLHFELNVGYIPDVTFLLQRFKLPDIVAQNPKLPTPFKLTPLPADHQETTPLQVEFLVDDGLQNYFQLYTWLQNTTFPNDYTQRTAVKESDLFCQATLTLLDYHLQPHVKIEFTRVLPLSLSGPWLDTTKQDVDYVVASATFDFSQMNIVRL